jgi:hypothetical protein
MHGGVDMAADSDVLARRRKTPTSHRQHQAFPPADPWSRGPAVLSTRLGSRRTRQLHGNASASDAQAAHSFCIQNRESVR